ncbi:unnamed protein product, partial [Discosporangium mesarthrocarpum]
MLVNMGSRKPDRRSGDYPRRPWPLVLQLLGLLQLSTYTLKCVATGPVSGTPASSGSRGVSSKSIAITASRPSGRESTALACSEGPVRVKSGEILSDCGRRGRKRSRVERASTQRQDTQFQSGATLVAGMGTGDNTFFIQSPQAFLFSSLKVGNLDVNRSPCPPCPRFRRPGGGVIRGRSPCCSPELGQNTMASSPPSQALQWGFTLWQQPRGHRAGLPLPLRASALAGSGESATGSALGAQRAAYALLSWAAQEVGSAHTGLWSRGSALHALAWDSGPGDVLSRVRKTLSGTRDAVEGVVVAASSAASSSSTGAEGSDGRGT